MLSIVRCLCYGGAKCMPTVVSILRQMSCVSVSKERKVLSKNLADTLSGLEKGDSTLTIAGLLKTLDPIFPTDLKSMVAAMMEAAKKDIGVNATSSDFCLWTLDAAANATITTVSDIFNQGHLEESRGEKVSFNYDINNKN